MKRILIRSKLDWFKQFSFLQRRSHHLIALTQMIACLTSCSKLEIKDLGSLSSLEQTPIASPTPAGTSSEMNLAAIPITDPDFIAPLRGAYYWLGTEGALAMNVPNPATWSSPLDHYARFQWRHIESDTGTFDFTRFDNEFKAAITAGRKFAFGVMPMCPANSCYNLPLANGVTVSYPLYLHTRMQTEPIRDWIADTAEEGAFWVPNWNSPTFLTAWGRMLNAIATHIETTSYNGVPFKNAIAFVDVHGLGLWGEWHNYAWGSVPNPAGSAASAASLISMIDSHKTAFPNFPLIGYMGMFAAKEINPNNTAFVIPAEVSCYAAQVTNLYGEMGWRRDNWGTNATWIGDYMEYNPIICSNGKALKDLIMNKWKKALITGEPNGSATTAASGGSCSFYDLEREVRFYHASTIGNGNWGGAQTQACAQNFVRAAMKASGYRIQINSGSYTSTVSGARTLQVTLAWRNLGVAPLYENWDVTFELRSASGTVAWSGISSKVLRLYLPETTDHLVTDSFSVPAGVAPGTYSLHLVVKDHLGYRKPLPLAIQGRASDGAYPLGSVQVQ